MRQDKIIFDGENPFDTFSRCKELTILLDQDRVVMVGNVQPTNIMLSFKSIVRETEEEDGTKKAYTIPLSLLSPIFKLDGKKTNNQLTIETSADSATLIYNDVELTTDIYSPNGLTLQQIQSISTENARTVKMLPFLLMYDTFGLTVENFINIYKDKMYIKDEAKCLIQDCEEDYGKNFAIPIGFVRLAKTFECERLHIGDILIAEGKNGALLICNMSKHTGEEVLSDYEFAKKIKTEDVFTLALNKNLPQIALAVKSVDISVSLDLGLKKLELTSINKERVAIKLESNQIQKANESKDFMAMFMSKPKSIPLNDARLIRTLATFDWVKVKVCPTFLIANLGKKYKLLFTLRRA